ncbi:MucB/RseB C-terminal domain-containing protein [Pseudomonas sp. TTU2014-080ASC]|uniref:MucB/RseB C-terminal domain-containing protein n=1 Tax=Pseudomonas sp. TTU2014-080ASC TaxID=1729724 RepID=UPI00071845B6|nr:MucB/RseB C-terminal domain-containing protein [Pseudomonas sp. TTU2014-080ASC]KRW59440.1 RNA polymerase subunit sigma [Pseudomonas sp. TTU2014-080ASC]
MRFIPYSVALLLSGCLAQAATAADGQDLLQRLAEAQRTQSFQGTFVYDSNGVFSTHGIWNLVDQGGQVHLRLLQLDGTEQEVLSVDGRVECATGGLADHLTKSQLWSGHELDVKRLSEWYEFVVLGDSRVAGRSTSVLALIPRDKNRYGFKLHLDRQTGLPLKSLLVDDTGQLLERFQFTRLRLETPTEELLQPGPGCRPLTEVNVRADNVQPWRSDWLPPGFTLSSASGHCGSSAADPVSCQVYGDGLSSFSVFMEPLKGASAGDLRTRLGPTSAVSRRIKTEDGDVMVTVVGEIPLSVAARVASSMHLPEGIAQ